MLALILATIWHFSAPITGGPATHYDWRQVGAWGDSIAAYTTTDTTLAVNYEPAPYRMLVRGVNGAGAGPWSVVSELYLPPRWPALLFDAGRAIGGPGLSGAVMGARVRLSAEARLRECWPDSGGNK